MVRCILGALNPNNYATYLFFIFLLRNANFGYVEIRVPLIARKMYSDSNNQ